MLDYKSFMKNDDDSKKPLFLRFPRTVDEFQPEEYLVTIVDEARTRYELYRIPDSKTIIGGSYAFRKEREGIIDENGSYLSRIINEARVNNTGLVVSSIDAFPTKVGDLSEVMAEIETIKTQVPDKVITN